MSVVAIRTEGVPVIDIGPFRTGDPAGRRAVAGAIAEVCERIGFLVIAGHGLADSVLQRGFAATREFFDLPQAEKDRWHPTGPSRQRGYHAFATRGLAYTLGEESPPDLRETLFLGPVDDHRAYYAGLPEAATSYAPNILPDRPPGVADAVVDLYRAFEHLSNDLLRLFAVALELPEEHFVEQSRRHFSIMSCHHYPALAAPPLPGQLRTGAHTDFGAMTILAMTDALGGLEARLPDGSWYPVQPGPGELVVNLGDMMARWTNDRWASTLHRVVNPPGLGMAASRRQSIGYFMHPDYEARIECLPTCLAPGEKPRHPTITAGEHIRLKIEKSHQAA